MSTSPHRIGLLGCGLVASYGHLPAIVSTPGLRLHAVYDPNAERLEKVRADFPGVLGFTDEDAFFASGLDAVSITSPAGVHLSNVRSAAAHGLPVLCEKPLAEKPLDARTMVGLMQVANLPLHVGFCYRFSPAALKIKELLSQGAIGDLRVMRLVYLWHLHGQYVRNEQGRSVINTRRVLRMEEGGPMVDCGVHQIDLARWWSASPVVSSLGRGAWVEEFAAPDHVWLHLDHASGVHTQVEMSFSYGHTTPDPAPVFTYELIGSDGVIRYDRTSQKLELRNGRGTTEFLWSPEKNFEGLYAAWSAFLTNGVNPDLPTGEDGVIATELAMAATEEAIQHRSLLPAVS